MSKLKICLLIPDFPICTGANTQALNLALNLNKLGAQTFLVFSLNTGPNTHKPCYDKSYEEKLTAADIHVYQKPADMGEKWASYKFYLKLFWRMRNEYQLIYITGISPMICWFTLFFKLMGKKVAVKMTGMGINDPITLQQRPQYNWFLLKLLALTDKFVGVSTTLCETYRKSSLFPNTKLVQIPNGVDTKAFAPLLNETNKQELKKKLNLPLEDKIVTYVGSIRRGKGIDLLINSWEKAVKQYPKATLLAIGPLCPICSVVRESDKEFIDLLKRKVGMYLFKDKDILKLLVLSNSKYKIQVLGIKGNIPEYLQASDVFVFLSRSEGMPNAVMEAMSSGLPCVTLDIGEISADLIPHEEVGHTIAEENIDVLISTIVGLLNDGTKRDTIGQAARQKMVDEYSIEKIAEQHYSLYQLLLRCN